MDAGHLRLKPFDEVTLFLQDYLSCMSVLLYGTWDIGKVRKIESHPLYMGLN
jgi:hypothetical protein